MDLGTTFFYLLHFTHFATLKKKKKKQLRHSLEKQNVLANVMPKKANWDLRRDVEKKMEKLEKRTQRAMVELMREEEERRMKEAEAAAAE